MRKAHLRWQQRCCTIIKSQFIPGKKANTRVYGNTWAYPGFFMGESLRDIAIKGLHCKTRYITTVVTIAIRRSPSDLFFFEICVLYEHKDSQCLTIYDDNSFKVLFFFSSYYHVPFNNDKMILKPFLTVYIIIACRFIQIYY